jgi:hypothetical protein
MSRKNNDRHTVFEILEVRSLLSTVNIFDFGARPNDGVNDVGAIAAAVRATAPGDTILFPSGVTDLPDGFTVPGNRTYLGQNGAIIRGRHGQGFLMHLEGDNATVRGLTFEGGGLFIDRLGGGRVSGITVDGNTFKLNTWGDKNHGITFTMSLVNSTISNNYITATGPSGFGIYGYNYENLTITNNEIVNVKTGGMHIDAYGNSRNLLVQQNYLSGIHGMGMEFQGTADTLKFYDNYYENPDLSNNFNDNHNTLAYSFILDKSRNIEVKRNTAIAGNRPDGAGCRLGFELGGDNALVEDNYVNGTQVAAYNSDGVGTTSMIVRNNRWQNVQVGDYMAFPGPGRTYSRSNNGANTVLSWDINRPKPGINRSVGVTGTPPAPTPSPLPTSGPVQYASDVTWSSARNYWGVAERDKSNGETSSGDGRTLTLNGVTYAKGIGVHAGSEIHLQLDGKYTQFNSDIGIDDEAGANGSVVFEVWADGAKLFASGTMTGNSPTQNVAVNVAGKRDLVLIVNGGANNIWDHADWAGARLTPA